jgi:hypothetical protein
MEASDGECLAILGTVTVSAESVGIPWLDLVNRLTL